MDWFIVNATFGDGLGFVDKWMTASEIFAFFGLNVYGLKTLQEIRETRDGVSGTVSIVWAGAGVQPELI